MGRVGRITRSLRQLIPPLPKRPKDLWRFLLRLVVIGLALFILGAILLFAWYFKDLPRPGELRARSASESTILYDRNGKQIYDISGDERRILVKTAEIPDVMKKATVAIEDKNFYSHYGVDFQGLIRGLILRPLTGRRPQGGSTITQQYVKNALLSPKRSITRKIKEIILSLELEAIYSKDDILALYLNEIPYGSNLYGIEAAAQSYFGHSAKEGLTLAQAATLAGIPQAPTYYSPYGSHLDRLIGRKKLVLEAMVKNNFISQEEADKARSEPPLVAKDFAQRRDNFPAPHFVMYVRELLVDKYGEQLVQRGGLRVTTTLDLDFQKLADEAVKEQGGKVLPRVKATNAGLVAIDPKTGQILAMVGSVDYFDREHEGNFNVTTASRQPGSAGKPVVYSALFKGKYSPASVLWDVQTDFNGYKPDNFDGKFHGPLTIRQALGNSYNIPAVKALSLTGMNNFLATARDMGITTLDAKKDAGLSLALGGGEVKLLDLTAAYAVLANHGERHPVKAILKIADNRGRTLDEWKASPRQVLAPEIAYQLSSILSDVEAKKATFGRTLGVLTVGGKTVAVKTGTTDNFRDAWTLGYTPTLAAGVWVGNNNNAEMDRGGGSTAAAPIWHGFMAKALSGKANELFYRPDSLAQTTVDLLSGRKPTAASGQLVQDDLATWQIPHEDDNVHQLIKICKSNGLLATEATPPDEVEERSFSQVHSERPDNSAWESPVQAWAKDRGLSNPPPTENCTIIFTDPRVKISTPAPGETVTGIFSVSAEVTFPPGSSGSVDFTIDSRLQVTDSSPPYTTTIDAATLSPGAHTISAAATSETGRTASDTITISVGVDTTPPGEVNDVAISVLPTPGSVSLTWTNPPESDLASVVVFASQVAGVKGAKLATVVATPSSRPSSIVTGLVSTVTNYLTFVPADRAGNSNPTAKQYPIVPQ